MNDVAGELMNPSGEPPAETARLAFGEQNRARILADYFDRAGPVTAAEAWIHVYRLLLWRDRRTGLAHCYESDKCQPGRPWYERNLRFHDWLSRQFGVAASHLAGHLDRMFARASADLELMAEVNRPKIVAAAAYQQLPYAGCGMPMPWDDDTLAAIITEALGGWLRETPPRDDMRRVVEIVTTHLMQENKRKNLLGEGFEDTLAELLQRVPRVQSEYDIHVRSLLHDLPGFRPPRGNRKPRQVDLALLRRRDGYRILVTAKWSIRSDREEQFTADFADYSDLEDRDENFDYVLVTNEFDAARLVKACQNRKTNGTLFDSVVHVNPRGPLVAYDDVLCGKVSKSNKNAIFMRDYVKSGRLAGLAEWIEQLALDPFV